MKGLGGFEEEEAMKRFLLICLLGLTTIFLAVTAHAQKPIYGGSLVVAQGVEPPGLDPSTNPSAAIPRIVYSNIL